MSNYNITLQSNNINLQAILNTINELPEAGGEQITTPSGICPSLTITGDSSIEVDSICYSRNGQYIYDFEANRKLPIIINNIDIGKPIVMFNMGALYEPWVSSYSNIEINLNAYEYLLLICTCTSTLPATLNIIDND